MKKWLVGLCAALLLSSGIAFAQLVSYPIWNVPLTGAELVQIYGVSAPGNVYVTTKTLSGLGTVNYQIVTPLTGFSLQVNPAVSQVQLTPAGTLSTGTIVFPVSPADGATLGLASTQTVSTLTLTASGTQTISGAITTITATAPAEYLYSAGTTTWYRIQ